MDADQSKLRQLDENNQALREQVEKLIKAAADQEKLVQIPNNIVK